ncbi:inositol-tetrakisphosphate 1-kinase 3-like [Primulina huaijiensis]|uniref:inositol-tetrakisphosphate 1-kinase 3-like n=1 Tax=Primulina huaijiensis TaxID=1492673 RepID=UPI003CC759AF
MASPVPVLNAAMVVGYALTSKKIKSFLQLKLERLAKKKRIVFVSIDPVDPFQIKLSGKEWRHILEDYRQAHPEATVLDPPDAIQNVHNRQSMLRDVADLNLSDPYGNFTDEPSALSFMA